MFKPGDLFRTTEKLLFPKKSGDVELPEGTIGFIISFKKLDNRFCTIKMFIGPIFYNPSTAEVEACAKHFKKI